LYGTHRHNTPALGSSFTALFTVTTVVFLFPLRDVIHRHITALDYGTATRGNQSFTAPLNNKGEK
jgi:hypothetical protein